MTFRENAVSDTFAEKNNLIDDSRLSNFSAANAWKDYICSTQIRPPFHGARLLGALSFRPISVAAFFKRGMLAGLHSRLRSWSWVRIPSVALCYGSSVVRAAFVACKFLSSLIFSRTSECREHYIDSKQAARVKRATAKAAMFLTLSLVPFLLTGCASKEARKDSFCNISIRGLAHNECQSLPDDLYLECTASRVKYLRLIYKCKY